MKLTTSELKQIIKEELSDLLNEGDFSDRLIAQFKDAASEREAGGVLGQDMKIAVLLAETVMNDMDIYGYRVNDGGPEEFLKIFRDSPKSIGGVLPQDQLDSLDSQDLYAASAALITKHIPLSQIDYDEFAHGSGDPPDSDTLQEMLVLVRKTIQEGDASFALIGAAIRAGVLVKFGDELVPAQKYL